LHLQLKGELNRSYRNILRIFLLKRVLAGISAPHVFGNFNNPKRVKIGTLLKNPVEKQKIKSLVTARGHKIIQNKNNRVASHKALSL
jgi:hypothetical protein